jgi:lipopolysaccharide transport protein LptA
MAASSPSSRAASTPWVHATPTLGVRDAFVPGVRPAPTRGVRAVSAPAVRVAAVLAVALALPAQHASAAAPGKLGKEGGTILIQAASSELDLPTNNVYFRKVHITQGPMSVTADQAQATQEAIGHFENGLVQLHGNVKINTEDAQLLADEAQIRFAKSLLSKAVAHGKPAEFQERIEKTGKVAHGHADEIDYDATKGLVVLSKNAWVSDGQYEFRGESFKYDKQAQRIIADPGAQDSQRVHIIITPGPSNP